jgi:hypothetical protein
LGESRQAGSEHSSSSSDGDITEKELQTKINQHDEFEEDVRDEDMCSADLDFP